MRKLLAVATVAIGLLGCGDNHECDPHEGRICTIAGNGQNGYTGEGGPALAARLSLPMDILAGPDDSLFVLDWNNHRIRKIMPDGTIHFVVGNGELGGSLDDPATSALNHPTNMAWDPSGTRLFVAAWHNSKIMALDPWTGEIVDRCGDGRRAYFGDDGPALTATLDLPASLAWSRHGELAFLDQANQVIRKIDGAGNVQLLAGQCIIDAPEPNGPGSCDAPVKCPEPSGKWTCGDPAETCGKPCWPGYSGDDIPATQMRMAQVFGQAADPGGRMVFDRDGSLYFADVTNHIIRKIDPDGIVRRVAGLEPVERKARPGYSGDGGHARDAQLNHPVDLALSDDGTLFISDVFNHCIRAVKPDGTIQTVVGVCGKRGYAGDGGGPARALLNRPYGIEWAPPNMLYIADTGNSVIRAVALD